MDFIENPEALQVIKNYKPGIQKKLMRLRQLIVEVAEETDGIEKLEETLKWGEPSYKTKKGSTIRINWKEAKPDQYAMYFICTTGLVGTYQMIYGDLFQYEGNRAITFGRDDELPEEQLKHCITLALTYHQIKDLPMLGA